MHVARSLVDQFRGLLIIRTEGDKKDLPVEKALIKKHDDVAAYLISEMDNEWWVL